MSTFKEEPFGNQLCKVQTGKEQDVIQDNAPEVEGIKDGSDPAGCCFWHGCL